MGFEIISLFEGCFLMKVKTVYFIAEQMTFDSDPEMGGAVQLMYIIRDLLDPENMLGAVNNKQEKTDFLNYFYKHCMHVLIGNDYYFTFLYFTVRG